MRLKTIRNCLVVAIFGLPASALILSLLAISVKYFLFTSIISIGIGWILYNLFLLVLRDKLREETGSVSPNHLTVIIKELAALAGVSPPNIRIMPGIKMGISSLNQNSVLEIGVDRLSKGLTNNEWQALLMHELMHVYLRSSQTMVLIRTLITTGALIAISNLLLVLLQGEFLKTLVLLLLTAITTAVAVLLTMKWSRTEEYLCDQYVAERLGKDAKRHLISGLLKLNGNDPGWVHKDIFQHNNRSKILDGHITLPDRTKKLGLRFEYYQHGYYTLQM